MTELDPRPFSYEAARQAIHIASKQQAEAAQWIVEKADQCATAERAYRIALAKEIVRQHDSGVAWTVCQDLARGDETVASLRAERDVAEGLRESASQLSYKSSADRRELEQLVAWSMKVEAVA